jgi:hypothetical protein
MKHFWRMMVSVSLVSVAAGAEPARFQEVHSLVQSNLAGLTAGELDQAALQGLLAQLDGRVNLVTNFLTDPKEPAISKNTVFDGAFAYVRVSRLDGAVAEAFSSTFTELQGRNKLQGLVLDLRFARGQDYAAAAALADRFIATDQALFEAGDQKFAAKEKKNAITLPVAVLVNRQTAGAPEALAAALRQANVSLLIGTTTAGQAFLFKDFPLSNGQKLQVATTPIKLAQAGAMTSQGVKPDITVSVAPGDERLYLDDAYRLIGGGTPGVSGPRRLTEAELVRQHREGRNPDDLTALEPGPGATAGKPVVRDPALVRALDLLKGLAVVKQRQPR